MRSTLQLVRRDADPTCRSSRPPGSRPPGRHVLGAHDRARGLVPTEALDDLEALINPWFR